MEINLYKPPKVFVDEFLALIAKSEGRDKFNKFIQFGSRFLMWILEFRLSTSTFLKRSPSPQQVAEIRQMIVKLDKVAANLAMARRVLRFGNFLKGYMVFVQYFTNKKTTLQQKLEFQKLLSILSTFFMAQNILFDHFVWAYKVGLLTEKKGTIYNGDAMLEWSNRWWLYSLLCTMIVDARELTQGYNKEHNLSEEIKKKQIQQQQQDNSSDASTSSTSPTLSAASEIAKLRNSIDEVRKKRATIYLNFIKNLSDVGIAGATLKYWTPGNGWIGLWGILSSVIAAYQMWPSS